MNRRERTRAFSLVELLVVVAIMALLISIAVPSFTRVRVQAKETGVRAKLSAIETAIAGFQAEKALGGRLPPSASDVPDGSGIGTMLIDPYDTVNNPTQIRATGASLLVLALAGPDKNGTAGFPASGGSWGARTGGLNSGGLYDNSLNPPATRYGPFAGAGLLDSMQPISELKFLKKNALSVVEQKQRVFVDDFSTPILYYRARRAARQMVTAPGVSGRPEAGIFDPRDNFRLLESGDHPLKAVVYDRAVGQTGYNPPKASFDRFILDEKASTFANNDPTDDVLQAIPHRKDDFMLITAGADGFYGTDDDITNWSR